MGSTEVPAHTHTLTKRWYPYSSMLVHRRCIVEGCGYIETKKV